MMNISTTIGCIPIFGSFVGIGRISIALNKGHEHQISNFRSSIFDSLSATDGYKEIYHGLCEIIPIVGPLLYGLTNLIILVVEKIWNLAKIHVDCFKPAKNTDGSGSLKNIESEDVDPASEIKGITSFEDLRAFIGKRIQLKLTRYAHESFDDRYRNLHGYLQNNSCKGILKSISDKPIGDNSRYKITLKGNFYLSNKKENSFYMSEDELLNLNT